MPIKKYVMRALAGVGAVTVLVGVGIAWFFQPVVNVGLIHCASIISQEAELIKKVEEHEFELKEFEQREIDLMAREQSVPVCTKKQMGCK